jgi:heme-degrading monooxygenase HmoA
MYARMMNLEVQPGKLDEALAIIRHDIAPVLTRQRGFKDWLLLADANRNKVVSITLWETMADLTEGEMSEMYQAEAAKVVQLLNKPPIVEEYDVSLQG